MPRRTPTSQSVFGPFCRVANDTPAALLEIARTGELLGNPPRDGMMPTVQAYFGALATNSYASGDIGLEFWTPIRPHSWDSAHARWYLSDKGVKQRAGGDKAMIPILISRLIA